RGRRAFGGGATSKTSTGRRARRCRSNAPPATRATEGPPVNSKGNPVMKSDHYVTAVAVLAQHHGSAAHAVAAAAGSSQMPGVLGFVGFIAFWAFIFLWKPRRSRRG